MRAVQTFFGIILMIVGLVLILMSAADALRLIRPAKSEPIPRTQFEVWSGYKPPQISKHSTEKFKVQACDDDGDTSLECVWLDLLMKPEPLETLKARGR